jgi:hypothetical protein
LIRTFAIVISGILLAIVGLSAQQGYISGQVTDTMNAVLPGVSITVTGPGVRRTVVTDAEGRYHFDGLPIGVYQIQADLVGFRPGIVESVAVEPDGSPGHNVLIRLEVGGRRLSSRDAQRSVEAHVQRLTDPNALDCGHYRFSGFLDASNRIEEVAVRRSLQCGLDASKRGVPFRIIQEGAGIDGWIAHGLLGKRDGTMFLFSYDSQPCGGPGCPERVIATPGSLPTVMHDGVTFRFACSSENTLGL